MDVVEEDGCVVLACVGTTAPSASPIERRNGRGDAFPKARRMGGDVVPTHGESGEGGGHGEGSSKKRGRGDDGGGRNPSCGMCLTFFWRRAVSQFF